MSSTKLETTLRELEENLEGYVATLIVIAYTIMILYNIIARFLFGGYLSGSLEVILGLVAWMTWLATAWAIRKNSHLRFTLIRDNVSNRHSYLIYWTEWITWIVLSVTIFYFSLERLSRILERGLTVTGTEIPAFLLYLSIPVGMVAILLRTLQQMRRITLDYRQGKDVRPEVTMGE